MSITPRQKRWLKQQVHHLKPVVLIGQHGLSDAVLAELELALDHHELLKIRASVGDREERDAILTEITHRTGAILINRIGNVAALYRANPRKREPLALPRD